MRWNSEISQNNGLSSQLVHYKMQWRMKQMPLVSRCPHTQLETTLKMQTAWTLANLNMWNDVHIYLNSIDKEPLKLQGIYITIYSTFQIFNMPYQFGLKCETQAGKWGHGRQSPTNTKAPYGAHLLFTKWVSNVVII